MIAAILKAHESAWPEPTRTDPRFVLSFAHELIYAGGVWLMVVLLHISGKPLDAKGAATLRRQKKDTLSSLSGLAGPIRVSWNEGGMHWMHPYFMLLSFSSSESESFILFLWCSGIRKSFLPQGFKAVRQSSYETCYELMKLMKLMKHPEFGRW